MMSLANRQAVAKYPATTATATETSISSLLLTTITMPTSLDNTNDFAQKENFVCLVCVDVHF